MSILLVLRIAQGLQRLKTLDADLAELERFYAGRGIPPRTEYRDSVAFKRDLLKTLRHSKRGAIAAAVAALTRLIDKLEHDEPDLDAANDAIRGLAAVDGELQQLLRTIAPPSSGCGSLIQVLQAIEAQQRALTAELRMLHDQSLPYPSARAK